MVREIVKDTAKLMEKSVPFVFGEDDGLIDDMLDTANEYAEHCVGLACVQIGVAKRVIVVRQVDKYVPMINPVIIKRSQQTFMTSERCLSLEGARQVRRHKRIKVCYLTRDGKSRCDDVGGCVAQVIQHECDHLNGILI